MDTSMGTIEVWFRSYRDELYRHALFVLANSHDAEDAVTETFIRAIKYLDKFEGKSSPRTWIWTILRNKLADIQRHQKRRMSRETTADFEVMAAEQSLDWVMWEQILNQLNFDQRQVFSLRVLQGFETHEAAMILGWTDIRIRVVLHRARKSLQEQLMMESSAEVWGGKYHG